MKAIFKTSILIFFLVLLIGSCSEEDLPILEIKDYAATLNENPSINQFIGMIPSKTNSNRQLYYRYAILSQSVENAVTLGNGGYYSTENISLYVKDETVFDFETNPIIIVTIKVNAVSYKLDFSQQIHDSKTIAVTKALNDLPE